MSDKKNDTKKSNHHNRLKNCNSITLTQNLNKEISRLYSSNKNERFDIQDNVLYIWHKGERKIFDLHKLLLNNAPVSIT